MRLPLAPVGGARPPGAAGPFARILGVAAGALGALHCEPRSGGRRRPVHGVGRTQFLQLGGSNPLAPASQCCLSAGVSGGVRTADISARCVIPASGYYEWLKRLDGRQPYFISAADGGVLSFAGLWDRWKNPETGEPVISSTIIVTDANALTWPIHDRMPVVLDKADIGQWLSGEAGTELLKPAAEDRLRMWPVSRRVNKTGTGDDNPTLIDEIAA